MPYLREVSREHRTCVLFLVDQSLSMTDFLGGMSKRKCDELTAAINAWLSNMIIKATGPQGVKDWMDIGVIGYRTDQEESPIIGPIFKQPLGEKNLVTITEVAGNVEYVPVTQEIHDDNTGQNIENTVQMPVWIDSKTVFQGGTPMCHALLKAHEIIQAWLADAEHQDSFPPIVVHITDGQTSDGGDPVPYAESLRGLATTDGNVLLFNCHLSETPADSFMFPSSDEILPDKFARLLFKMSSELPESIYQRAVAAGLSLQPGARGMAFNADLVCLINFLDLGTRLR